MAGKYHKKLTAILLAVFFSMVIFVPSFAAQEKSDLDICVDLGMLKGREDGITQEYLDSQPDRVQAALLFLRLKGLGETAEYYTGDVGKNFPDAGSHAWGSKIMAYLYANPQLGWRGDEQGNFMPNKKITAQEYYKILLTALGYTQATGDNPGGDFTWLEVYSFAGEKGLGKVAGVPRFTVGNLVTATVEALKAEVKRKNASDPPKTLIAQLVEEGCVDSLVAQATGLYEIPDEEGDGEDNGGGEGGDVSLDVASVEAVSNTKVHILLNTAVRSVDKAAFSIADSAGRSLAVAAAALYDGGKLIRLTTGPQTPGKLYKLNILTEDSVSHEFAGMADDASKPVLLSVAAASNTSVRVVFSDSDLDEETALDTSNYSIKGLSIQSAAWGDDRSQVMLYTSAQSTGTLYELKAGNISDLSGNVMAETAKKFAGKPADTVKPVLKAVVAADGNKVKVTFTEKEKLDPASAEDLSNYSINKGLAITGAELDTETNKPGMDPVVVLHTGPQTLGTLYTLTVRDVRDEAGNVMNETVKNFAASSADNKKLNLLSATAQTNTSVLLVFDDEVDAVEGSNAANYTINDLTVVSADVDGATVTLVTSPQTAGKLYTVVASNLTDDAGNALDVAERKFGGIAADTVRPTISSVAAMDPYTVRVVFSEKVQKAGAETISNYFIENLGYPAKARLESDGKTVTLSTQKQSAEVYVLEVANVADLSGNTIAAGSRKSFTGISGEANLVKLDTAYPIDRHTIKLIFNKELKASVAENPSYYSITSSDPSNEASDISGGANISLKNRGGIPDVRLSDDYREVTITFSTQYSMNEGEVYTVRFHAANPGIFGTALDPGADRADFAGISTERADILMTGVNVIDSRTLELIFSEDLAGVPIPQAFAVFSDENAIPSGSNTGGNIAVASSISGNKVRVTLTTALKDSEAYFVNMTAGHGLTDATGMFGAKIFFDPAARTPELAFATGILPAPVLKPLEAFMPDENTLKVTFNYAIDVHPTFNPRTDVTVRKGSAVVVDGAEFSSYFHTEGDTLTLFFKDAGGDLVPGDVLTLFFDANPARIRYISQPGITLDQTEEAGRKVDFAMSSVENPAPYLLTAQAVSDTQAAVVFSEPLGSITADDIRLFSGDTEISRWDFMLDPPYDIGDGGIVIKLRNGLVYEAGVTYTIVVRSSSAVTDIAGIGHILKDDASTPDVYENSVSFPGIAVP